MDPVNESAVDLGKDPRHGFIGFKHKFLDKRFRAVPLSDDDIESVSLFIQRNHDVPALDLHDRSPVFPVLSEDTSQFVHQGQGSGNLGMIRAKPRFFGNDVPV